MITKSRPAIFIDRDGTLVEEVNFLSDVADMRLFDFSGEALQLLRSKDFLIVMITNQSGIGRGKFTESAMHQVNDEIGRQLPGLIDGVYFCPHRPDDGCSCRKPRLGMIENAISDFDIDRANSWVIGDKKIDVETGFNGGFGTALVLTGYGQSDVAQLDRMPDIVAPDLLAASREIVRRLDQEAD
jgi:D-glycero-D-manno-heptose 1,7-bisphosphate phosphatase